MNHPFFVTLRQYIIDCVEKDWNYRCDGQGVRATEDFA